MAPKKKKQAKPKEEVPNQANEDSKEPKQAKELKNESNTEKKQQKKQQGIKGDKNQQKKDIPKKIVDPLSDHHQRQIKKKISLEESKPISEAERLEQRKLRFNIVGTQINAEEAQKIRQERLQKFGGVVTESKEIVDKRKQKFGQKGLLDDDDKQTIAKRRQKFNNESQVQKQDEGALKERRQKFGGNDISLDTEIQKSKSKNKFQRSQPGHMGQQKHYPNHKRPKHF